MGLENIDQGSISLGGEVCVELRGRRTRVNRRLQRQIGMVFQHYTLFPHLSVIENLILAPVRAWGEAPAAARDRALVLLSRLDLRDKQGAYPNRLSGGQKQRVAIARALMLEPKVMLFDEVTSALDPELIAEVLDVMLDLAQQQMAMIIITHEMTFARRIASRIVFLDKGSIVEEAPPDQFFLHPREERSRRFLRHFFGQSREPGFTT
jgi:polar amino acid transport system ATP-binding protein